MTYDQVVTHFPGVRQIGDGKASALCPAHEDSTPSLSITRGEAGRTVLHCHAGCAVADVLAAVGLTERDLFADERPAPTGARTYYDYLDESGNLLYQAVRIPTADGKTFRQRRPDGKDGWIWNLQSTRRVLYHLPELLAASPDQIVHIAEGEKDVENLRAIGELATTNPQGAGKWRPEYSEVLRGRHVVMLPDNDPPGAAHGAQVAQSLRGIATSIKVVLLPGLPPKGDVSDWLAAGHAVEELRALVAAAPLYGAEDVQPKEPDTICLATVEPRPAKWLWFGRLASGEIVVITGAPGVGKGLLLCYITARYTTGRPMHGDCVSPPAGNVLWISVEDAHDSALVPRLRAAGADLARVHAWLMDHPLSLPDDTDRIVAAIDSHHCGVLIIDPAPTLLDREHSSNNDADVRRSFAPLAHACRERGCALILVRHTNKRQLGSAMDRGGGSIGWTGMARIELMLGRPPIEDGTNADADTSIVTLAPVKSNLGRWPRSLNMRIVEVGESARIEILGVTDSTADDLCAPERPKMARKTDDAEAMLRRILGDGQEHRQREIREAATAADIGWRTVMRSKADMDIRSIQRDREWWWYATPGTVAAWHPGTLTDAGTLTSNNNTYLGPQSAIVPGAHTVPGSGILTGDGEDAV